MSMLDKLKEMIKGHPDQAEKGVDKVGDTFDSKTGGKYSGQVDKAQDKLKGQFGQQGGDQNPPPPQPPQQP